MTVTQPDGREQCVGYLFNFQGHGIFAPDGKVEVTQEEMDIHNKFLAQGEIKGLDEQCQVGQGGTFYYIGGKIQTFTGEIVSSNVRVNGKTITFRRNGKSFRGRLQKDADCFNFRRVA